MLDRISRGRTDLVWEYVGLGHAATSKDTGGVSLLQWCAYYGDVSAIRFLLANGETLAALGENLGLNAAAFHGHWRLSEFLLENGADPNAPQFDELGRGTVAWGWGLNGAASVVGSILAVTLSMNFGFTTALIVGILVYLAGLVCFPAAAATSESAS